MESVALSAVVQHKGGKMFRDKDVIKYRPENSWCKHGIAVFHFNNGSPSYFKDTYWGVLDTSYYGEIRETPVDAVLIGNLDDFEFSPYKEYNDYKEEDKFHIPSGGGSSQNWFRKRAEPDPTLIYNRLAYELEEADNEIGCAQRRRDYQSGLLREHINKHGIPVQLMDKETE
jgi:hypothetical protein